MAVVLAWCGRLKNHKISRNASWLLLGQGANFLLQAAYFVLLARVLGVKEYGVFAGAFAIVNLITPYSAMGAGMLFMRYVTEDRAKAATYWGNSLIVTAGTTTVIVVMLSLVGPAVTKIDNRLLFVVLGLANCLCSQIANLGSVVFQTFEKMRWTAALGTLSNLGRCVVLVVMRFTLHNASAYQWSVGVLVASGAAAICVMVCVRIEIGAAQFNREHLLRRLWEGFGFSFAGTTQAAYNDVDKVMLSHYGLNRENGFYTLAYRIVDVATTPVAALDAAMLPQFFRLGQAKKANVLTLAAKGAASSVLLGLLIAAIILLFAPLVPHLVGRDFSGALTALKYLCWIPLLRGIHRSTGSALTGSGRQNLRTGAQVTVAGVNLLLNMWWIPVYGWIGAAWSSLACDGLLAVLNSVLLLSGVRRGRSSHDEVLPESEACS